MPRDTEKTMRWYPNLVAAAAGILEDIFEADLYADQAVEQALKSNAKWGSRDRAFIAETVYEVVRWYRLLYTLEGAPPQNITQWQRMIGWHYARVGQTLPDWPVFEGIDFEVEKIEKCTPAEKASIPDWLEALGRLELGNQWPDTIEALNQPARVVLRTNRIKCTPTQLKNRLEKEGVEVEVFKEEALLLSQRKNLSQIGAFKDGWFEIQDYSSQQVAPFLQVKPGMTVIDACAGAGGKTLHLAALMENNGRLLAMDVEASKLRILKNRAQRAGADIIETQPILSQKSIVRLFNSADRVLLDAPCSGLGVLRRNPDAKWKLQPDFIDRIKNVQSEILLGYSKMVRPGGLLVYATCSILPAENQKQVETFLQSSPGFRLLKERSILPQEEGFDGFYMASLERVT